MGVFLLVFSTKNDHVRSLLSYVSFCCMHGEWMRMLNCICMSLLFFLLNSSVIEKHMAQSLHIGSYGSSTNLPFGICAIYFDLKVSDYDSSSRMQYAWWTSLVVEQQPWIGKSNCHG